MKESRPTDSLDLVQKCSLFLKTFQQMKKLHEVNLGVLFYFIDLDIQVYSI